MPALVAFLCVCAGCGHGASGSAGSTLPDEDTYVKRTGVNDGGAVKFVQALEQVPAADRRAYLMQHPTDARNLALVRDPALQKKIKALMENRP